MLLWLSLHFTEAIWYKRSSTTMRQLACALSFSMHREPVSLENAEATGENVTVYHLPETTHIERLAWILQRVDTPYFVFRADRRHYSNEFYCRVPIFYEAMQTTLQPQEFGSLKWHLICITATNLLQKMASWKIPIYEWKIKFFRINPPTMLFIEQKIFALSPIF